MDDVDSDDHDQEEVIIIPIKDKTKSLKSCDKLS